MNNQNDDYILNGDPATVGYVLLNIGTSNNNDVGVLNNVNNVRDDDLHQQRRSSTPSYTRQSQALAEDLKVSSVLNYFPLPVLGPRKWHDFSVFSS